MAYRRVHRDIVSNFYNLLVFLTASSHLRQRDWVHDRRLGDDVGRREVWEAKYLLNVIRQIGRASCRERVS